MEFCCGRLYNQPVRIKMTNDKWEQELELCCRFQPALRDGYLGFQCGALFFGGPIAEVRLVVQPDETVLLLFPEWNYEISPVSMEVYEDSRDPFSDSEYMTPELMMDEVEEALGALNLPRWLESTWNEYFSIVSPVVRSAHERTA